MEKVWFKSYDSHVPQSINTEEYSNVSEILHKSFTEYASRDAFSCMGTTFTYEDIEFLSRKFASYLQNDLGLKKGERVAIMLPNILQYPVVLFGVLRAGMVVVNVNPLYTARELKHQLNDSGAKAIIIFENACATLQQVLTDTPVEHVLVTAIGDMHHFPKSLLINSVIKYVKKMVPKWNIPGARSLTKELQKADENKFNKPTIDANDIAFLQYTGGTTGVSKGAELLHRNIVANLLQIKSWVEGALDPERTVIITPLPLYHIFSLTANCFTFSMLGAHNILITNPRDIPGFIKELKKWRFTVITGVNTLFNALLNNEEFKKLDFSALQFSLGGGMAVQKAVADKWKEVTGLPLIEGYGLTETSPVACVNPLGTTEYNGFIGVPVPNTEVTVKDEQGQDLPVGEVGEICIRGPQVMKGYWNRPEETKKVMTDDNYFKSGDMGMMTAEGFFKIVDRKKDMILVSGFNVYPNEIEDVLAGHPKVLEAAAVGVADDKSGEVVKVFVVKKDQTLTEDELKLFCKDNLTGYKVPKFYEFRNDLPKTNVGKILRRELRN